MTIQLFKIVTSRDEIVVGLTAAEPGAIGGDDVAAIARKLVADGLLSLTQYAVRRTADGLLEQGPLRQVAVLANESLRIEPYASPLPVAG